MALSIILGREQILAQEISSPWNNKGEEPSFWFELQRILEGVDDDI